MPVLLSSLFIPASVGSSPRRVLSLALPLTILLGLALWTPVAVANAAAGDAGAPAASFTIDSLSKEAIPTADDGTPPPPPLTQLDASTPPKAPSMAERDRRASADDVASAINRIALKRGFMAAEVEWPDDTAHLNPAITNRKQPVDETLLHRVLRALSSFVNRWIVDPAATAVNAFCDACCWLWASLLAPAGNAIVRAVRWAWAHLSAFGSRCGRGVGVAASAVANAVDRSLCRPVAAAVRWITSGVCTAVESAVYAVVEWLLKPILRAIVTAAEAVVYVVVKCIARPIARGCCSLGCALCNGVTSGCRAVLEWILQPAFDACCAAGRGLRHVAQRCAELVRCCAESFAYVVVEWLCLPAAKALKTLVRICVDTVVDVIAEWVCNPIKKIAQGLTYVLLEWIARPTAAGCSALITALREGANAIGFAYGEWVLRPLIRACRVAVGALSHAASCCAHLCCSTVTAIAEWLLFPAFHVGRAILEATMRAVFTATHDIVNAILVKGDAWVLRPLLAACDQVASFLEVVFDGLSSAIATVVMEWVFPPIARAFKCLCDVVIQWIARPIAVLCSAIARGFADWIVYPIARVCFAIGRGLRAAVNAIVALGDSAASQGRCLAANAADALRPTPVDEDAASGPALSRIVTSSGEQLPCLRHQSPVPVQVDAADVILPFNAQGVRKSQRSFGGARPTLQSFLGASKVDKVSLRFQAVFVPLARNASDVCSFAIETYSPRAGAAGRPRREYLFAMPQSLTRFAETSPVTRLLPQSDDGSGRLHWMEVERTKQEVGVPQPSEAAADRADAIKRKKATAIRFGPRFLGKRFNAQLLVEVPLTEAPPEAICVPPGPRWAWMVWACALLVGILTRNGALQVISCLCCAGAVLPSCEGACWSALFAGVAWALYACTPRCRKPLYAAIFVSTLLLSLLLVVGFTAPSVLHFLPHASSHAAEWIVASTAPWDQGRLEAAHAFSPKKAPPSVSTRTTISPRPPSATMSHHSTSPSITLGNLQLLPIPHAPPLVASELAPHSHTHNVSRSTTEDLPTSASVSRGRPTRDWLAPSDVATAGLVRDRTRAAILTITLYYTVAGGVPGPRYIYRAMNELEGLENAALALTNRSSAAAGDRLMVPAPGRCDLTPRRVETLRSAIAAVLPLLCALMISRRLRRRRAGARREADTESAPQPPDQITITSV